MMMRLVQRLQNILPLAGTALAVIAGAVGLNCLVFADEFRSIVVEGYIPINLFANPTMYLVHFQLAVAGGLVVLICLLLLECVMSELAGEPPAAAE
jgi:hypothetical protein